MKNKAIDRRPVGIRHARPQQGLHGQHRADAGDHGAVGGADARDEERHRRQGPDVRGRGLHRRPRRAARRRGPGPERGLRRSRRSTGAADHAALHPARSQAGRPAARSPAPGALRSRPPPGAVRVRRAAREPPGSRRQGADPLLLRPPVLQRAVDVAAGDGERDRPERAVPAGLDRSRARVAAHAAGAGREPRPVRARRGGDREAGRGRSTRSAPRACRWRCSS